MSDQSYWAQEQQSRAAQKPHGDGDLGPVSFEAPCPEYIQQFQGLVSNCKGRKKALLIGINYCGTSAQLSGCVSDVQRVRDLLCTQYGFQNNKSQMLFLSDEHNDPFLLPTRTNIIEAMHWLVRGAEPGDSLFFQFSGHGTRVEDLDGDEDDGYDEAICPLDYESAGLIIDDEINEILVHPLPPNTRLTAISDSCHSGSVLDLPYTYCSDGRLKVKSKSKMLAKATASTALHAITGDYMRGVMSFVSGVEKFVSMKSRNPDKMACSKGNYFSDVILISGCKDEQTSADTNISGVDTGALTHAFVEVLKCNPSPTYRDLLIGIRNILYREYSQKPQLSSGRLIDMNNSKFFL